MIIRLEQTYKYAATQLNSRSIATTTTMAISVPIDIYDVIGDHVTPQTAARMRAANSQVKDAIDFQWEESTTLIPDGDRIDPLEPSEIIAQVPRGDPIPFDLDGDIRHITAYMKSMYGESITLLTPDLFEKLEGKIVNMIYYYPEQNQQLSVVDNLFSKKQIFYRELD